MFVNQLYIATPPQLFGWDNEVIIKVAACAGSEDTSWAVPDESRVLLTSCFS